MTLYIHVFKWEMRRKKERSKQGQTNKQGKESNIYMRNTHQKRIVGPGQAQQGLKFFSKNLKKSIDHQTYRLA